MDERVKAFLEKKQQEIKTKTEKEKEETLLSLGIYEKVYSPNGNYTSEYNLSEWDNEEKKSKFFKKVPPTISNEEFKEIQKFINPTIEKNTIAFALSIVAWIIFIIGFIAGIVLATEEVTKGVYYTYTDTEFSIKIAIIYWAISLISGLMMLGFAEVIKLLNEIKNKN